MKTTVDIYLKPDGKENEFEPTIGVSWESPDPAKILLSIHPKDNDPVDCLTVNLMPDEAEQLIVAIQSALRFVKDQP